MIYCVPSMEDSPVQHTQTQTQLASNVEGMCFSPSQDQHEQAGWTQHFIILIPHVHPRLVLGETDRSLKLCLDTWVQISDAIPAAFLFAFLPTQSLYNIFLSPLWPPLLYFFILSFVPFILETRFMFIMSHFPHIVVLSEAYRDRLNKK